MELLRRFKAGKINAEKVLAAFQAPPETDLLFAKVDAHRALRKGFPEVIYGAGKTAEQIFKIASAVLERESTILITRVTSEQSKVLLRRLKGSRYHEAARCITVERKKSLKRGLV